MIHIHHLYILQISTAHSFFSHRGTIEFACKSLCCGDTLSSLHEPFPNYPLNLLFFFPYFSPASLWAPRWWSELPLPIQSPVVPLLKCWGSPRKQTSWQSLRGWHWHVLISFSLPHTPPLFKQQWSRRGCPWASLLHAGYLRSQWYQSKGRLLRGVCTHVCRLRGSKY